MQLIDNSNTIGGWLPLLSSFGAEMKPLLLTLFLAAVCFAGGQDVPLPKDFPDPYDTSPTYGPHSFLTTEAYTKEARRLVLEEATKVATEMGLPEELPLTESNIVESVIAPFGLAYIEEVVGNVTSHRYRYYVREGWRFSRLTTPNWTEVCASYARQYRWPSDRLDTNAAYNLATQWLAAISMDVAGLNRDCVMQAVPAPPWNRYMLDTHFTNATFTPIYLVYWVPRESTNGFAAAAVKLFAPDQILLSLTVEDPKYILRKPLQFTNLDELLANPTSSWHRRLSQTPSDKGAVTNLQESPTEPRPK